MVIEASHVPAGAAPLPAAGPASRSSTIIHRLLMILGAALGVALVAAVWAVQFWYLSIGTWAMWEAEANSHYVWLSHGLVHGQLDIPVSDLALQAPLADLIAAPDPYLPEAHVKHWVPIDVSYYQGKFYLYFGVVPAAILALLLRFTGFAPPDDSVLVLGGMFTVIAAGATLLWRIRRYFLPHVGWWYPFAVFLLFSFGEATFMLLERPAVYQATILCGQAFLLWGIFLALPVWCRQASSPMRLVAIGGLWGLAWGSRLSLLTVVLLLTAVTAVRLLGQARQAGRLITAARCAALAALPFASIVLMGLYNQARFGNWLETGQQYQFTSYNAHEQRAHLFKLDYLLPNTLMLLTEPVKQLPEFPYIALAPELSWPKRMDLPEYMMTESPVVGLAVSTPFVLLALLALVPMYERRRDLFNVRSWVGGPWPAAAALAVLGAVTALSEVTVASQRYTAIRYRGDFLFLAILFTYLAVGLAMRGGWFRRASLSLVVLGAIGVSLAAGYLLRIVPFLPTIE